MPSFPPRLHVLLARDSDIAVVLRRGPSKSVCSILWHRRDDSFELGQWMRGRIYERRADLSPDGRYLIYFAMNGHWNSDTRGSWTAISRAPFLKAIVLLGKGDCWHGGGLFKSPRGYWLNDGYGHRSMLESTAVERVDAHARASEFGGECPGVYYPRLVRDGWAYIDQLKNGRSNACTVFEKPAGDGWILRKLAHEQTGAPPGKGCYWDEHELEHTARQKLLSFPDWEWADVDRRGLMWAEHGQLSRARLNKNGIVDATSIHDFNDMKFQAIAAPY